MTSDTSNDNGESEKAPVSPAHGQAAMLLVESLIHGMIESKLLTVAQAVDIVDGATEVAVEIDGGGERSPEGLLAAVSSSLRRDLPDGSDGLDGRDRGDGLDGRDGAG